MTTIPEFAWRIETCGTCDNHGNSCYDCNGVGNWYASCADCGEERPLNTNGVCESCQAVNGWLPVNPANFFGTVCASDPFLRKDAA